MFCICAFVFVDILRRMYVSPRRTSERLSFFEMVLRKPGHMLFCQGNRSGYFGTLTLDNQEYDICVSFNYNDEIVIWSDSLERGLRGSCEFSPDELIVSVTEDSDDLFNYKYKTITFVRT